jgi:hypothetical protein
VLAAATHAPRAGSCKELAGWRSSYGRLYLVRLFYKLYFWLHFHYKNGDCIENDYHAVSGPSGASDCRDSFVSRCRISVSNAACSDGPHSPFSLGANRGQTCSHVRGQGCPLTHLRRVSLPAGAQSQSQKSASLRPDALLLSSMATCTVLHETFSHSCELTYLICPRAMAPRRVYIAPHWHAW